MQACICGLDAPAECRVCIVSLCSFVLSLCAVVAVQCSPASASQLLQRSHSGFLQHESCAHLTSARPLDPLHVPDFAGLLQFRYSPCCREATLSRCSRSQLADTSNHERRTHTETRRKRTEQRQIADARRTATAADVAAVSARKSPCGRRILLHRSELVPRASSPSSRRSHSSDGRSSAPSPSPPSSLFHGSQWLGSLLVLASARSVGHHLRQCELGG